MSTPLRSYTEGVSPSAIPHLTRDFVPIHRVKPTVTPPRMTTEVPSHGRHMRAWPMVRESELSCEVSGGERTRTADFYVANGLDPIFWTGLICKRPAHMCF